MCRKKPTRHSVKHPSGKMRVSRGDVVVVELSPIKGSEQRESKTLTGSRSQRSREQRGTHPCLVVQKDVGNRNAPTTIVVSFTTSFDDELYPFEVLLESDKSPLKEDSAALCSQIRTVSVEHRVRENLGRVPKKRTLLSRLAQ